MTTKESSGNKTGLILGIVGGIIVLALVAVVVFATEEVGAEYGDPVITGSALPLMPQSAPVDVTATGLDAPEVVGQNFSGDEVRIVNDGRAKAIVFLAHWCPHCQVEVPKVQAWINSGGGEEGVDLYAVATSMDSTRGNFPPSEWLETEGWTAPVLRDDNENSVLVAYGQGGFPFWTFVNADGTVALRASGEMPIEQLQQIMSSLQK
jgi:thiol-disulfide isomerase/thioredoxin